MKRYIVDSIERPWGEWKYRVSDVIDDKVVCLCRSRHNADTIASLCNSCEGVNHG